MTRFEVVEAKAHHVGQVVHNLRAQHSDNMKILGIGAHRALREAYEISSFRRSWMIDGRVAAIGGVTGPLLCTTGIVWLAFTQAATRFPVQIIKEARRQLAEIMAIKTEVDSAIVVGDEAAWRFASFLGFDLKLPDAAGNWVTLHRETPKNPSLESILRRAPEFRVELPAGAAGVLVGYSGAVHG